MKRFSFVLVAFLVFICGITAFAFAEEEVVLNNSTTSQGIIQTESMLENVVNIMDKVTKVALPICVLCVAFGAVQFFILGIRNLYKKKQGLLMIFSSMTFYVVLLIFNFALTLVASGEFNKSIDVSQVVENVEQTADQALTGAADVVVDTLRYVTEWSLPFCAILLVFGAVQYYVLGIRNLYKKRQGLLLMFGSIAFFAIMVVLNFMMQIIF